MYMQTMMLHKLLWWIFTYMCICMIPTFHAKAFKRLLSDDKDSSIWHSIFVLIKS
jgi:hypothetical protein